ncbi:hypothetical protein [Rhodococcus sp. (in: high G+C Gram-positive bacteria)]|uniref:hypothetical protein n=1 Tax=Rhodococcus sp. TaxID=1831 RepID=UPI002587A2AD|nr:hypothetical protein [Rhodococcus sp. (in: high G+C Gram-positive bacteria)]MCX6475477.1 hypothetical protein [Rhodococcus sp. (in: high G+C Gram-positive bacteria)]
MGALGRMAGQHIGAVEERVAPLGGRESYDREFIFDLLLAYGKPKGNVTRLRTGPLNVAADPSCEVAQKNIVYFRETLCVKSSETVTFS